jgi:hypothetical protein
MDSYKPTSVVKKIRQSPPLDFSKTYDASWVKDKVILITGGASGFGAGFVRKWASNGATVIVGDINVKNGLATCRDINKDVGGERVHFVHCDVTDWQSQVDLFKEAVKLSPHGGLDCKLKILNKEREHGLTSTRRRRERRHRRQRPLPRTPKLLHAIPSTTKYEDHGCQHHRRHVHRAPRTILAATQSRLCRLQHHILSHVAARPASTITRQYGIYRPHRRAAAVLRFQTRCARLVQESTSTDGPERYTH